ncbi:hypothetical protein CKM354_000961800 [Cercospora kikuchii]|uniref:Uncharacterized protein n=1 Tax=Cercospora kikuchii TaxID=84275 RepID=A0A9P3CS06_9PEZI|nr:uncharacterized protein CKM354_000961800 [Cercospora kikuchii]GIZ46492.1 hypothetical protein CKM354_000961800 [Cercospora kikuchii]
MAAVLIVLGGAVIAERVEKSKEKKRLKKEHDDTRYRELVEETGRRLSQTDSNQIIRHSSVASDDLVEDDAATPPPYEEVVRTESTPSTNRGEPLETHQSRQNDEPRKKKGIKGLFGRK